MTRLLASLLVLCGLAGCAVATPVPVRISGTVGVLPPNNLTGERLAVAGTGLIDRYVRRIPRVTLGDVLLSEARFQLLQKGFVVRDWAAIAAGLKGEVPESPESAAGLASRLGLKDPVLYLEIRRWEPDAPTRADFVIVGLAAAMVDPSTGTVLWQAQRKAAPVATPGEVTVEAAFVTAARKVMQEMLAPLQPEPAPVER
jgi:hypothetical protein